MNKDWIIEKLTYNKQFNMVQYKTIKRFYDAETALDYLNKNKNKAIELSSKHSVNTECPIIIATDKARKELAKVRD